MYTPIRIAFALFISAFLATACTGSSVTRSPVDAAADTNPINGTDTSGADSNNSSGEQSNLISIGVAAGPSTENADITDLQPLQATLDFVADKTFRITWLPIEDAEFYRILENPDGISGFTQIGNDIVSSTLTFDHRVALYERADARYIVQACNAGGCWNSDELLVTGSLVSAIGYFKRGSTDSSLRFGYRVALSADGHTMAVAAIPGIYIFARIDQTWQQQAILERVNPDLSGDFADVSAMSLSADGSTLAVGSSSDGSSATGINGNSLECCASISGAAYVFTRTNDEWKQQAYIKASNSDENDSFGSVVSLSADGKTLAIGAHREDGKAAGINGDDTDKFDGRAGAAYVFARSSDTWQQQAYVKAKNTGGWNYFGSALSLSADGNTLAVGAPGENSSATGINGHQDNVAQNTGAVYLY